MERVFKGRPVAGGKASLKALVSREGFNTLASYKNCKDGYNVCTDQNNKDLYGKSTVGVALCLPQTIGSTTGGMVLYNAAVIGCNPAAMLFSKPIDSLAAARNHPRFRLDGKQNRNRRQPRRRFPRFCKGRYDGDYRRGRHRHRPLRAIAPHISATCADTNRSRADGTLTLRVRTCCRTLRHSCSQRQSNYE